MLFTNAYAQIIQQLRVYWWPTVRVNLGSMWVNCIDLSTETNRFVYAVNYAIVRWLIADCYCIDEKRITLTRFMMVRLSSDPWEIDCWTDSATIADLQEILTSRPVRLNCNSIVVRILCWTFEQYYYTHSSTGRRYKFVVRVLLKYASVMRFRL